MEELVILNYDTLEVHFYKIDNDIEITEDFIKSLGHNPDECSWMFGEFILSEIIGPFGLLPVFIVENTRHNKGEVDTFMTDRFATCVGAMVLGIGILVIIATNICNG